LIFLIPLFLFWACAPSVITDTDSWRRSLAVKRFREAENLLKKGDVDRAFERLETYVRNFPRGPRTDQALIYIGEIYIQKGGHKKGLLAYQRILSSFPTSLYRKRAQYGLAYSYWGLGKYNDSLQILKGLLLSFLEREEKVKIYTLSGNNYLALERFDEAISMYIRAYQWAKGKGKILALQSIRKGLSHLSEEGLLKLKEQYGGTIIGGYVEIALTDLYQRQQRIKDVRKELIFFQKEYPDHELTKEAKGILMELEEGLEVVTVGCILPLSNKLAPYGERVLRGIKLAENLFQQNPQGILLRLVVKDSKGDPGIGEQAVADLVEEGAIAILGPLGRVEAMAAARKAQELGVPIITLTQREGITELGDFVFRDFLRPDLQIEALVDYAINSLGLTEYAILYPDNSYGNRYKNLFVNAVEKSSGIIVGVEHYSEDLTNFQEIIPRLDATFCEAVFIPDTYEKIAVIAPQFAYCDVTDVRLLGTNLWNAQKLVDIANEHLQGALFIDGFFKNHPSSIIQRFVENFYLTFWEEPQFLEAQGYDVMRILLHVIKTNIPKSRAELKDTLHNIRGFPGITGTTGFTETGDAEKQLFVLGIQGKRIIQLN